jgi:hypothetical protein
MDVSLRAPLLVSLLSILLGCEGSATVEESVQEPVVCTAVGCVSNATANFLGVLATLADEDLPLSVHVCVDDTCVDGVISAEETDEASCVTNDLGTLCCRLTSAADELTSCHGVPGDKIIVSIPMPVADESGGGVYAVSGSVTSANGALLASGASEITLAPRFMSGPDCGVSCYSGGVGF